VKKKSLAFGTMVLLLVLTIGLYVNAANNDSKYTATFASNADSYVDITDITVEEAWAILNDPSPSNGIQIPIDVRTDSEWFGERIDTPYPEDPRHYLLSKLYDESGLQEFISLHSGKEIVLYCKSGGRSSAAAQIIAGSNFNGIVYNMLGGITAWKAAGFPTKVGNQPPLQPDVPSGITSGDIGIPYMYSTSAIDPDDDSIIYGWDWDGDNTVDEWTTNFYESGATSNISHSWSETGTYYIRVKAEDTTGERSNFSVFLAVVIGNAPSAPVIAGQLAGKLRKEYSYTFTATDSDGDAIYYYIEWGDGSSEKWIGPYASGEEVVVNHSWDSKGIYTIKAKAKDINGAESEWGTLQVSMPKTYGCENPIWVLFEKINNWFISITGKELLPGIY